MSRAERAKEYFMQGYACSQAVALAFSDLTSLSEEQISKLCLPFGGGFGRQRLVCGAVSGFTVILGLLFSESEVSAETLEREKEVLKQQAINEGKPEAIAEKMVMGRIKKFYEENCLLEQAFIKDDSKKIAELLKPANVNVNKFVFFVMGEGLEKKSEDLGAEVAKQVAAMQK